VAGRVVGLSTTFQRSLKSLGIEPATHRHRVVLTAVRALATAEALPGAEDYETRFSTRRAHVRRVPGHNVWLLYRFDPKHVYVMTARGEPPVPVDH
jgi:hypothetical protein